MKKQITKNQQGAAGLVLMLALVVVLFCVVLVRAYVSNHNELKQKKIEQTIATLTEAQNALIGFATRYGRLPCPAMPNTNGLEVAPSAVGATCLIPPLGGPGQFGILPWATLGVKGTDAWGNLFTYKASRIYTRKNEAMTYLEDCGHRPLSSSIASCSRGDMTIRRGVMVEPAVPAVIISHGPNGIGAYRSKDGKKDTSSSPDANERINYTDGSTFFASLASPVIFDDIVFWVDNDSLIQTLIHAYKFKLQNPPVNP